MPHRGHEGTVVQPPVRKAGGNTSCCLGGGLVRKQLFAVELAPPDCLRIVLLFHLPSRTWLCGRLDIRRWGRCSTNVAAGIRYLVVIEWALRNAISFPPVRGGRQ